jgi:hypothetical protein
MPIAIISSFYRVEVHLERFTQAVLTFAKQVHQAGIDVHYLPIVNDATPLERESIDKLASQINDAGYGTMTPHYVGRETLYASWNRGISLTDAPYFTFWNADDVRDASAFIEGYHALEGGANLVDFLFTGVKSVKRFGLFPSVQHEQSAMLFNPEQFTRKNGVGPFFMTSKVLYEQVGKFDEHFRIGGDMQWAGRTLPYVQFYPAQKIGGYFYIHGDNLSNTGTTREAIEVNITFMRRQDWHHLIPTDPTALRDAWETWGALEETQLPDDVVDFLWGDDAKKRWQQYEAERNQMGWIRRIRQALAARGLIHSAVWSVYLRSRNN